MIQPVYNIRHWFPCDKVVTSYDGWYNPNEYVDVRELPENKESVEQAPLFFF